MARAMWKGSIAFGLVNIPVELYSATRDHRPKFRLLHAKDESPVHYERVCQRKESRSAGRIWSRATNTKRGSSSSSPKTISRPRQSRRRRPSTSWTSSTRKSGRALLRDAVYLQPGKGADRAYALLREAIRESGKIGIAKIILRDAQHLAARGSHRRCARADDDALCRRTRRPRGVPLPEGRRHPRRPN